MIRKYRKRNPIQRLMTESQNAISCPLACAEQNCPFRRKKALELSIGSPFHAKAQVQEFKLKETRHTQPCTALSVSLPSFQPAISHRIGLLVTKQNSDTLSSRRIRRRGRRRSPDPHTCSHSARAVDATARVFKQIGITNRQTRRSGRDDDIVN